MSDIDLSLTIGGPQGGGIDTSANMISRAFASSGFYIFGVREYHSNIKGRHSYTHLRVKGVRPRSLKYPLDVLVALDPDTVFEHLDDIGEGTKVIYDHSFESAEIVQSRMIMRDTLKRIKETLDKEGVPGTVSGALECMKRKGAILIGTPFAEIVTSAVKGGPATRYFNTLGAAITLAIVGVDEEFAIDAIKHVFSAKEDVALQNEEVVKAAYNYCKENNLNGETIPANGRSSKFLITGNDAVAIGKLIGGLRFQTYYPITPASDESTILEEHEDIKWIDNEREKLEKGGVVTVQTEDELSAITMATGGAITGARSSTATSGPGFALMAEAISFAGMDEIPLVITLYQRGGPSTGLPTRNGQSDLLFALNTGHGEFPRIVMSSGDVEECIYDSIKALNYAQKYQLPVIHLVDKNLASTMELVDEIHHDKLKVEKGLETKNGDPFKRYNLDTENGVSAMGYFGKKIFWMTGDEHDELGHVTEDTIVRDKMMEKRFKKLVTAEIEIPQEDQVVLFGKKNADVTFVTWGSQKGPVLDVIDDLAKEGVKANLLYFKMFEPFPVEFVKNVLENAKTVIDVESNMFAQAAIVIKWNTGITIDKNILKYNGRHMTEDEILNATKEILGSNKKEYKVVLKNGA